MDQADASLGVSGTAPHSSARHYLEGELYERVGSQPDLFEFLQAGSLDGIWYWDVENPEHEWMSARFWETLGYDPGTKKHLASEWQTLIHPDDLQVVLENFRKHCADPKHPYDQVVRYRHKDGSTVWVRCRGIAIRDASGRPVRFLGAHTDVTQLVRSEESLREAIADAGRLNRFLDAVVENIPLMVFIKEAENFRFVRLNRAGELLLGRSRADLIGTNVYDAFPESEADHFAADDREVMRSKTLYDIPEEPVSTENGVRWVHTRKVPILDESGKPEYLLGISEDITERREGQEAQARLAAIVDSSDDAIFSKSFDGLITSWNAAAARLFGFTAEEVLGKDLWMLIPADLRDEELQVMERLKRGEHIKSFDTVRKRKDGTEVEVAVTVSPIKDKSGANVGISTIARDITEMKSLVQAKDAAEAAAKETQAEKERLKDEVAKRSRAQAVLRHAAQHDGLTKLLNRDSFLDRYRTSFARMKRDPSHEIAVLFLDVDRFKTINDTFGHQAGDRFLVLFARRLATCLRPHDVLARLGGDEFTILLEGITGVHGACVAAERILDALAEPFRVDDWEMQGSTSIGIVLGAPGYEDPEAMLRDADIAMYRAKQAGGGCYEVFARERHLRTG